MRALLFLLVLSSSLAFAQQPPDAEPTNPGRALTPGGHIPLRNVDVLSDTQGLDLTPYLRLNVHFIQHNWWKLTSDEAIGPSHELRDLVLEFTVARDGALIDAKLTQPSSDSVLDQAALEALRRSSPFQALPSDYAGESLALRLRLHYDPNLASPSQHWAANSGSPELDHAGRPSVPKVIYGPPPEFTDEARRKKIQGVVTLRITVSETGNVTDAVVTKGLGYGLDQRAIETIHRWKFKPALKDGEPISTSIAVDMSFHLY
jgi:TonB family protein